MAMKSPLLKAAVCALAAKHLSRVDQPAVANAVDRLLPQRPSPDAETNSQAFWSSQAVEYHDRAISFLKEEIDLQSSDDCTADTTANSLRIMALFASIAILSMFELADAPADGWRAHMLALPWFNATNRSEFSGSSFPPAIVRGPIFWSLVRQDFCFACRSVACCWLEYLDSSIH